MARPIDEKIVAMKMDNSDFKAKVKDTLRHFSTMSKGLSDVGKGDFSGLTESISQIESRFSSSGVVIATIINRLTNSAIDLGKKMAGAVMDPLIEGGKKRALNIEQAKFQFEGLGMDIEQSMADALYAVKGTAYGLDEAAVAASQFGASGIQSGEQMQKALRGISGVAAMSGRSFSDVSNIFTKVAGQGRVMGDDLNRLGASGINAAATLGEAFGKSEADIRKMVSNGAISFEMFSGAMSDAFGEHATKASETYTGSLSNMNAALARIGASMAAPNFENNRRIFNALTPVIDQVAAALEPLIEVWVEFNKVKTDNLVKFIEGINIQGFVDLGGAANLAQAFFNVLNFGRTIMGAIVDGFKAMIGVTGGDGGGLIKVLVWLSAAVKNMTSIFTLGSKTVEVLSKVFQGIFSVLGSVWIIVKELAISFSRLLPEFKTGGTTIRDFAERIADLAIALHQSFVEGNFVTDMIRGMGDIFAMASIGMMKFGDAIYEIWNILAKGVFTGKGPWEEDSKIVNWLFKIREAFESIYTFIAGLSLKPVGDSLMKFFSDIGTGVGWTVDLFSKIGAAIAKIIPDGDTLLAGGFIATLVGIASFVLKMGWDFIQSFKDWATLGSSVKDMVEGVTGVLGEVGGALSAFALEVKSKALINVAIAVGILAASFWILSSLDSSEIASGLYMLIGSITALVGALMVMDRADLGGSTFKTSVQLVALALAVGIMAVALRSMKDMGWEEISKGLVGLAGTMAVLAGAMILISKFGSKAIGTSVLQIIALAGTLYIMTLALKGIVDLKPEQMEQGLKGVVVLISILALALGAMAAIGGKTGSSSLQIVAIAGSVMLLVEAIKKIAKIDPDDLTVGLRTIGLILGAIAAFTLLTSDKGLLSTGTGLTLLAVALNLVVRPIRKLGEMDYDTLKQGLGALAIMLAAVAAASLLMKGSAAAGAGLLLLAVGMNLLIVPIAALGAMNLSTLAIGIGALAVGILAIGGAAIAIGTGAPLLLAGAGAIAVLGLAMLVGGLGLSLFATGLVTLATMSAAAITAIVATLGALILGISTLIPQAVDFVSEMMVKIAESIAENSPIIAEHIFTMLSEVLAVVVENAPLLYDEFLKLVLGLVEMWGENMNLIVDAVIVALITMLETIAGRVGEFIEAGTSIITNFLTGIGDANQEIVNTAMTVVIDFIDGMTEAVRENGPKMTDAVLELMGSVLLVVIDAGVQTINALFGWIPGVKDATAEIGATAEKYIDDNFGAEALGREKGEDFSDELDGTTNLAKNAAESIAKEAEKGLDVDTSSIGSDFGGGFAIGISAKGTLTKVANAARTLANKAASTVKGWLKISSPSRVARDDGGWFGSGLALGIMDKVKDVASSAKSLALTAKDSLNEFLDGFELPEEDNELHFKAIVDYEKIDVGRFGNIEPLTIKPDTSMTRGLVSASREEFRQNRDISSEERGNQTHEEVHHHQYDVTIEAGAGMTRAEVRTLAQRFQEEVKNINDRTKISRGEEVSF